MIANDDHAALNEQRFRDAIAEVRLSDRRRQVVGIILSLFVAVTAGVWLLVSVDRVQSLSREAEDLKRRVQGLERTIAKLELKSKDLAKTQEDLLSFLGDVASEESIRLIDPGVDWEETKAQLVSMPAGPRKSALFSAILVAWKEVPFSLTNNSFREGLDSPHFIELILRRYGIYVQQRPAQRLSEAMMYQFRKVERPLPGDLIFYRGNVGNFVVMYIGPGRPNGKGVAIGTLQTGEELRVLDTADINTPVYPFIGYFRVPYPINI